MTKSKPAYLNDSSGTKVKKTVHHSREDVVSDSRYDQLLAAADRLSYPFDVECRFVLIGCGRLGLRAGELCHVTEDGSTGITKCCGYRPFHPATRGEAVGRVVTVGLARRALLTTPKA